MTSKAQQERLAFEAGIRANAVSYRVHLFLGRGQYDRADAATSDEALALGAAMKVAHPACQAQPMFYAIEPSGHSIPITPAQMQQEKAMINVSAITGIDAKRAKKAEAQARYRAKQKVANAPAPAKSAKPAKASRKAKTEPQARAQGGKRAEILAKAENGKLPAPPDFTAPTHARFRDKLAQVVAMAKAGDLAGLKAFAINPVSSSPKAIDRYRNLAVIALDARAAKEAA